MSGRQVSVSAATVVVDIEGTTSATGAIIGGLYEYAKPRLRGWIDAHGDDPEVAGAVAQVIADAALPERASSREVVEVLHRWMAEDVKATPLKTLQGKIWAEGFARGELTAHFFPDVIPSLRRWHAARIGLTVFSSGSVASQLAWFGHSADGDLTGLFGANFDTVNAGPKKLAASYEAIAAHLATPPGALLFLSDHPDELSAASDAGWRAVAVRRPGEPYEGADFGEHTTITSFDELEVTPA